MADNKYVKRVRDERDVLWDKRQPVLTWLDIELTERCNLNCQHCCINLPAADREAAARELTAAEIGSVLEQAADLGCLTVRLTGGEPLLRADFSDIYVRARELGMKVVINTNATLLTPKLAELLAKVPPLEMIAVSVYGMSQTSYEAVTRISGSFAASREGIRLLLEHKIPFGVRSARLPANQGEFDSFLSWAQSLPAAENISSIDFATFFDLRCRRDSEARNREILRLRPTVDQAMAIMTHRKKDYIRDSFCVSQLGVKGDCLFSCGAGNGMASLDSYGRIQPCLRLRHPATVFDLRQGSLADAVRVFFPAMRQLKAKNPEYLKRCAHCFLRGFCEQCPARSWMEHGTLDTPVEYFCDLAVAQTRFLRLLGDNELPWETTDWTERVKNLTVT